MRPLFEVPDLHCKDFKGADASIESFLFPNLEPGVEVVVMNSGKAALNLTLEYYRSIDRLQDVQDEILVPQWIGAWVYNAIQKVCFPTLHVSERTRGVMVYHQYGYPQKMLEILKVAREKKWFVIEDCAHALQSHIQGQRLGFIGDVGIYSFSKFFPSVMGGALVTRDPALAQFVRAKVNEEQGLLKYAISALAFWAKLLERKVRVQPFNRFFSLCVEMTYAVYERIPGLHPRAQKIIKTCLSRADLLTRTKNYQYFLNEFKDNGIFSIASDLDVTPYVLPLFASEGQLDKILKELAAIEIETGKYHFDRNRNLLAPDFVKCVWIPVHAGVTEEWRKKISAAIRRGLQ